MITIHAARIDGTPVDATVQALPALLDDPQVYLWVDLFGPMENEAECIVRDVFKFHPLAIEDCFGAREQPKIEPFDGYVYLITHGIGVGSTPEETNTIELDIFLGKRYVVTHHEKPSRTIDAVQQLVRRGGDFLRRGPVVLLHAILERQVDFIEPVVDAIDERVATLEERVLFQPSPEDLAHVLALRRSILHLRRWIAKQRDVVLQLARNDISLTTSHDTHLFRDVYDHLARFVDLLENYRELTTSVQDAYLSISNQRLNETMKFLTVFTATLMPLTVITGIYGMNFEHMPELKWQWGYFLTIASMALTSFAVLRFFRRKGLIGKHREAPPPRAPDPTDP